MQRKRYCFVKMINVMLGISSGMQIMYYLHSRFSFMLSFGEFMLLFITTSLLAATVRTYEKKHWG